MVSNYQSHNNCFPYPHFHDPDLPCRLHMLGACFCRNVKFCAPASMISNEFWCLSARSSGKKWEVYLKRMDVNVAPHSCNHIFHWMAGEVGIEMNTTPSSRNQDLEPAKAYIQASLPWMSFPQQKVDAIPFDCRIANRANTQCWTWWSILPKVLGWPEEVHHSVSKDLPWRLQEYHYAWGR